MVALRGDVFWVTLGGSGSARAGHRPAVVVQHDRYNRSAIGTTIVAAITSNLRLSGMSGNVRLAKGEAGLPRACVVNISQLATLDRAQLSQRIGSLSAGKRAELIDALALILGPDLARH